MLATEAAECAGEQGAFWDYSDLLFANRATMSAAVAFDVPHLKAYANALGLEAEAFDACLSSHRYRNSVEQSTQSAQAQGVRATPTFLINGQFVEGALPFESFQQIIEAILAEAS